MGAGLRKTVGAWGPHTGEERQWLWGGVDLYDVSDLGGVLIGFWFWSQSNLGGCVGGSSRGEAGSVTGWWWL